MRHATLRTIASRPRDPAPFPAGPCGPRSFLRSLCRRRPGSLGSGLHRKTSSRLPCSPPLPWYPPLRNHSVIPLGCAGYITPPVPRLSGPEAHRNPRASENAPKVFLRRDHGRIDGGAAWLLRGPFPRIGSRDTRGRSRPGSLGTTQRRVSALPRGIARSGSPRGEWVRRPDDATSARLAREGRRPPARVAAGSGLRPLPSNCPAGPPKGGRPGLLSLSDLRQWTRIPARGPSSAPPHSPDPRFDAPRLRTGPVLAVGRRHREFLGHSGRAESRPHPHGGAGALVAERPADRPDRPPVQRIP